MEYTKIINMHTEKKLYSDWLKEVSLNPHRAPIYKC